MARVDVGDDAPLFELEGTGNRRYRLDGCRGHWLILAFYPGDFTPVCTSQFCSYRDAADRLDQLDATVWGLSPQSVESHERFRRQYDLTVTLLADPGREVIRAYGVLGPAGLVRRSIFIIDPAGKVRYRHVALLGLHYRDVDSLRGALEGCRSRPAA